MVRRPPTPAGCVEHERELFAHPLLADEVLQDLGSQSSLDDLLVVDALRGDDRVRAGTHARLSSRRLVLSNAATSGASPTASAASASGPTAASASSTSRVPQPRPTRAERSWSRQAPTPWPGRRTVSPPEETPSLSLSSSTRRWAPLRPTPGTNVKAPTSSVATATRTASGECTESTAWASFGPTPLTDCRTSNTARSSALPKPNSVNESSRTTRLVDSSIDMPGRIEASVAGVHCTASPTPPTSTTALSPLTAATRPLTLAITELLLRSRVQACSAQACAGRSHATRHRSRARARPRRPRASAVRRGPAAGSPWRRPAPYPRDRCQ